MATINRLRLFQSSALIAFSIVLAASLSESVAQENGPASASCPSAKAFADPSPLEWMGC